MVEHLIDLLKNRYLSLQAFDEVRRDNILSIMKQLNMYKASTLSELRKEAVKQGKPEVEILLNSVDNLNENRKILVSQIEELGELVYELNYELGDIAEELYNLDTEDDFEYYEDCTRTYMEDCGDDTTISVDDIQLIEIEKCYVLFIKDIAFTVMLKEEDITEDEVVYLFKYHEGEFYIADVNGFLDHVEIHRNDN